MIEENNKLRMKQLKQKKPTFGYFTDYTPMQRAKDAKVRKLSIRKSYDKQKSRVWLTRQILLKRLCA
jgi:hypothetical protein